LRGGTDLELGEVVFDALVGFVLLVDLQDAAVLDVGSRENLRRLAGQKNPGVGAVTVNEAADDDHGAAEKLRVEG